MAISMAPPPTANDEGVHTGRIVLLLLLGLLAESLSLFVVAGCEFVHARWVDEDYPYGDTREVTTGVLACKEVGLAHFGGPTNAFDSIAAVSAFVAPLIGIIAMIHSMATHWYCCCDCCWPSSVAMTATTTGGGSTCYCCGIVNPRTRVIFLFGLASIVQLMTLFVLVAPTCSDDNQGDCTLLRNGYFSIVVSLLWLLCAGLFWKTSNNDRQESNNNDENNNGSPEAASELEAERPQQSPPPAAVAVAVGAEAESTTMETEKTVLPDGSTKTRTVVKNEDGSFTITETVETTA